MRSIYRVLLLAVMLTTLATLAAAQVNPRANTPAGNRRPDINPNGNEPQPQLLELRCRGGGALRINVERGEYRGPDLYMNMTVHFERASEGAGFTSGSLAPGQCALPERALFPSEPTEMRAEVINFGQRNRQMHGDTVYHGDQAAEKYPDAENIPVYLANPNHYWSFFGFNTFDGYFRITNLRYWQPRFIRSPGKSIQIPGSSNPRDRVKAQRDERIPGLTGISVQVRWKRELGLPQDPQGRPGFQPCDVFRVVITTKEAGTPGTFGSTRTLASFDMSGNPNQDGHSYLCSGNFFPDNPNLLPREQQILVTAGFDTNRWPSAATVAWKGGSDATPPTGQERVIGINGVPTNYGLKLTDSLPHQTVDFEMFYAPIPEQPH